MGDKYRATLIVEVNNVATANVLHFDETAAGSGGDPEKQLNELLTDKTIVDSFAQKWAAFASAEATVTCVKIQKVDPAPTGTLKIFFDTNVGDVSGDCCPSNVAAVVRQYSTVATRRGRGRSFFAGVPEESTQQGRLTDLGLATLQAIGDVLTAGMGDAVRGTWEGVVYSKLDDVYRNTFTTAADSVPRMQVDRTTDLCAP